MPPTRLQPLRAAKKHNRTKSEPSGPCSGKDEPKSPKSRPKKRRRVRKAVPRVPFARGFSRPTHSEVKRALGAFEPRGRKDPSDWELRDHFADAQGPKSVSHFSQIPDPVSIDDWLAQYAEEGQTFDEYRTFVTTRSGRFRTHANVSKRSICLLPIGSFEQRGGGGPRVPARFLERLTEYTAAFFAGERVVLLPSIDLSTERPHELWWNGFKFAQGRGKSQKMMKHRLKIRYHAGTGRRQVQVDSLLSQLAELRTSREFRDRYPDAFCLVGVTLEDLYDTKPDLFVAGMAAGGSKVGVFQFFRYDPALRFSTEFWYKTSPCDGRAGDEAERKQQANAASELLLARSCKLLVHEICHIYGIDHCKFYDCVMNGSGHLAEDFRQPFHLCPVDLRKLAFRLGLGVQDRYRRLHTFCQKNAGFAAYGRWIASRTKALYGSSHKKARVSTTDSKQNVDT